MQRCLLHVASGGNSVITTGVIAVDTGTRPIFGGPNTESGVFGSKFIRSRGGNTTPGCPGVVFFGQKKGTRQPFSKPYI